MQITKRRLTSALTGCALLVLGVFAAPAAGASDSVSQLTVPISGEVFDSDTGEYVALDGRLHLALNFDDDGSASLHANVAEGSGVGLTSGLGYSLTGADQVQKPDGPPIRATVHFRLRPEGPPISPQMPDGPPIRVAAQLFLSYGDGGQLTDATVDFSGAHD